MEIFWANTLKSDPGRHDAPLLSPDENARASRYRRDIDRDRFLKRRGLLRLILGCRLRIEPSAIRFGATKLGKPFIVDASVQFSVSHSHDIVMVAICDHASIGCDVERLDPELATPTAAEQVFSAHELGLFRSVPAEHWTAEFFRRWTLVESHLKAVGRGFLGNQADIDDAVLANAHWLRPTPGFQACVVVSPRAACCEPCS